MAVPVRVWPAAPFFQRLQRALRRQNLQYCTGVCPVKTGTVQRKSPVTLERGLFSLVCPPPAGRFFVVRQDMAPGSPTSVSSGRLSLLAVLLRAYRDSDSRRKLSRCHSQADCGISQPADRTPASLPYLHTNPHPGHHFPPGAVIHSLQKYCGPHHAPLLHGRAGGQIVLSSVYGKVSPGTCSYTLTVRTFFQGLPGVSSPSRDR